MPDARTSPYKPLTNQVERRHRSIDAIMGKTAESHQKDWDTRLNFAMSAYRASRLESTDRYTPNMLTLGTEVTAPADIMYGSLNEPSSETYDDCVQSMRERMTTAYEETQAATRGITTYEYEPKSTRKPSGYTTSILVNLSDAKTNGSGSILAPSYCRHTVTSQCTALSTQGSQDHDSPY